MTSATSVATKSGFRQRLGRYLRVAGLTVACLTPSLFSLADQRFSRQPAPAAELRLEQLIATHRSGTHGSGTHHQAAQPLALHIHMVHLREFDLREGKAIARFEFHNAGADPLKILQVKPSCGCVTTRLRQPDDGFAPQASGEFFLEVDTAAEATGFHEYDVRIDYRTTGEKPYQGSQSVLFRVDVPEKQVAIRPRALIFYQLGNEPTSQSIDITDFRRGYDLEVLDVRTQGEHFTVGEPTMRHDEQGNRHWTFPITAAGQVPSQRHTGAVLIETNDAEFPLLRLPVLIYGPQEKTASAQP